MRFLSKRRAALLCAGLGTVGAASAFTFGATSAQYTSSAAAQDNSIVSGTITLAENAAASTAYNITNLMPGDGSCYSSPYTTPTNALYQHYTDPGYYTCDRPRNEYALSYTGSNPAFVGLDINVTSTAAQACTGLPAGPVTPATLSTTCTGTGQLPLFDGNSGAGELDLALTPENGDTSHQLVLDSDLVSKAACVASATSIVTCTSAISNVLMPVNYGTAPNAGLQWVTGSTDFVQIDTAMPRAAGNQFQGSGVHIGLQSHAIQWDNNNTTKGAVAPSAVCDVLTTFPNGLSAGTVPCPISWS